MAGSRYAILVTPFRRLVSTSHRETYDTSEDIVQSDLPQMQISLPDDILAFIIIEHLGIQDINILSQVVTPLHLERR